MSTYQFAAAGLNQVWDSVGYTGNNERFTNAFNYEFRSDIALSRDINMGTAISGLADAIGQAVSGVSTNISGGTEVGNGRF